MNEGKSDIPKLISCRAGMSPEEFKFRAYLGGNGHGKHITDGNIMDHIQEPAPSLMFV